MNKYQYLLRQVSLYTQKDGFVDGEKIQGTPEELGAFWDAYHRPMKQIAKLAGISQYKLADYFGIPHRTMEDWCRGARSCAAYVRMMMQEILGIIKRTDEEAAEPEVTTKYVIYKDSIEIRYRDRKNIKPGCVLDAFEQYPEEVASFDTAEEAREALKTYRSDVSKYSGAAGTYYLVTEYYAEETRYDEDGDLVESGDILDFSEMDWTEE